MKKIFFFSLIFLLIGLYGCSFEPGGEHFEQLDSTGKLPDIEVDLNLATDTIYIQKNEWIKFSYKTNGDKVNWAQFIINGQETSRIESKSESIQLSWYFSDVTEGTFPLVMKVFTKSQTGSIADKVGAEGFLMFKEWTIVIKGRYQMGSNIKKCEFVDGSLKIDWEMFKGTDFKSYKVYKDMDYLQNSRILVTTIHSQEQTTFIDRTYHGERSNYYIVTNDEFYSSSFFITGPLPELSASNTPGGDILLKWNKPPFYNNLKGYRISYRNEKGEMQQLTEINNTATESWIFTSPRFAYTYELYLILLPLTDNFYDEWNLNQFLSTKAKADYGVPSPKFVNALGGLAPIAYLYEYNRIRVFDNETFLITSIIEHDAGIVRFAVSSNNKYLVSVVYSPGQIFLDVLNDPMKSKQLDLSVTFPQMGHIPSVSDIGTGIVLNNQTAVLYNYLNESKLGEIQLVSNGLYGNKISPSGNFFFCETYNGYEFLQYKDKQIIRLPGYNDNNEYVLHADYLPGNSEKLIRAFNNRVEVLDCNTWKIEKTWLFSDQITEVYNLDMKSGNLFLRVANNLILFDVENGTKEQLLTTGDSYYLSKWNLIYNNGQILWGEGKRVDMIGKN
jgi:hypothetical protein